MHRFWGGRTVLAGIAGAAIGLLVEALVNGATGTIVVTDGLMWGAVVGVLFASLPSFSRMGYLTVKSDKPAVNFVVGIGLFIVISAVSIIAFFGIFWLIGRILS